MPLFGLIADHELGPIRRNPVIVVAPVRKAGVDPLRFAACHRQAINAALAVEQKRSSVTRPVRSFNVVRRPIDDPPVLGSNRDGLQRADRYVLGYRDTSLA